MSHNLPLTTRNKLHYSLHAVHITHFMFSKVNYLFILSLLSPKLILVYTIKYFSVNC